MHKFVQKSIFKGPWDTARKMVKEAINNCEIKYKRWEIHNIGVMN